MDIASISAIVAAAGVLVGVALTYLEVRNLVNTRRTDVIWRQHLAFNSKDFLEAWLKVFNLEFKTYNDFVEKHGVLFSGKPISIAIGMVGNLFESTGHLLARGLVDYDTVSNLPIESTWERLRPIVEGVREQLNYPKFWGQFEYLYNVAKKREQTLTAYQ